MNADLLSAKMLLGTAASTLALVLIDRLFGIPWSATTLTHALWISALAVMTHEKIGRCDSPFTERALRFSGFVGALFFVPQLVLAASSMTLGLLLRALVSAAAVGTLTVWLCYRLDPAGPGRYFSVSAKFNNR